MKKILISFKNWICYFFGSFFVHNRANEVEKHSYLTFCLSLLIGLIILIVGNVIGDISLFSYHYSSSKEFNYLMENYFSKTSELELIASNNKIKVINKEKEQVVINSLQDDNYCLNGYYLFVDTRDTNSMYDDFEAYCKYQDKIIGYEEYLLLPENEKSLYQFYITYTGNELILTDELINKYEDYLQSLELKNKDIYNSYKELKKEDSNYKDKLYELYIEAYYPSLKEYEQKEIAPRIRNYYLNEIVKKNRINKYLIVFDDIVVGSFYTDKNLLFSFYGFPNKMEFNSRTSNIVSFLEKSFKNTTSLSIYVFTMNVLMMIPYFLIMLLGLSIFGYCFERLVLKNDKCKIFICAKLIGSFYLISALITSITTIILNLFLPRGEALIPSVIVLFIVLFIRTLIYYVHKLLILKKEKEK